MARHNANLGSLSGQLLFAEVGGDELVLDCILSPAGATIGTPITLTATLLGRSRHVALQALERWTDEGAFIEIRVVDDERGPHVVISSESSRVELEPAD